MLSIKIAPIKSAIPAIATNNQMLLSLPAVEGRVEGLVVVATTVETGVSAVSVARVVGLTKAVAVVKLVGLTRVVAVVSAVAVPVVSVVAVGAVCGSGAALIDPTSRAASNVPITMLSAVENSVAVFLFKIPSSMNNELTGRFLKRGVS